VNFMLRLQVEILRYPLDERFDGPSADLDAVEMRAISTPGENRTVVVQSVASHYNDRSILTSGTAVRVSDYILGTDDLPRYTLLCRIEAAVCLPHILLFHTVR
jgi:hypothetical protein